MNEIEWLAERRPETAEPGALATARARAALLEHAETPRTRAPRRTGRRRRVLAAAAVAAAASLVAVSALPGGDHAPRIAPPAAEAAPLVRLAAHIQQAPAPPGDATLVLRTHDFPDSKSFTGADLYLDDGRYYYAPTRDGLTRQTESVDADMSSKREREAAAFAVDGPPDEARTRMIAATLALGPKTAGERPAAKRPPGPVPTPASQRSPDDNRVWIGCMDALISGAGRADVRAGVLKLLALLPSVRVETAGDTLSITDTSFYRAGYQETLLLDAQTGVIRKMVGGMAGEAPEVTVTYDVRRVDAAGVLR